MALPEILTKTTAGLPNWAWGLAIIGGVGVGVLFNKQASTPALPVDTSTSTDTTSTPPASPPGTLPPVTPPAGGHTPYTVQHGDTVNSVAAKVGVTPDHLWQDNRYEICQCVKKSKIPCSYRRGPLAPEVATAPLCKGMTLFY